MSDYKNVKIIIEGGAISDYYELESILKTGGINASIINDEMNGSELGLGFGELIVLIPLITPVIIELRKIIVSYLKYRQPLNKKTSIDLEYNGKKIRIESENDTIPNIDELMTFFNDTTDSTSD